MADNEETKKADYEKLDAGDEEAAKKEPFLTEDPDPESKPPKEKPHPGARRSTFKSICIALAIVLVVVVIIGVVAVVLITQDKSGSKSMVMNSTTMSSQEAAGGMMTESRMSSAANPASTEMNPTTEPEPTPAATAAAQTPP